MAKISSCLIVLLVLLHGCFIPGLRSCTQLGAASSETSGADHYFFLPLEELLRIPISSGTLIPTSMSASPSALSLISAEVLKLSGARRLDDAFDILIPNVQIRSHHYEFDHIGIRGIISDRDDKYLLLVNGRVMTNRTHAGSISERDLPMLGDIQKIEFIRGPASATYGPGALIGAINIVTYDSRNFHGSELTLRQGLYERYTMAEYKQSFPLSDDSGLFVYYGVSDYDGASLEHAPYVYGSSFTAIDGTQVIAGEPADLDLPNDRSALRGRLKHKLHVEYNNGPLDIWLRYTKGNTKIANNRGYLAIDYDDAGNPVYDSLENYPGFGMSYSQLTATASFNQLLSPSLSVSTSLSFDTQQHQRLHGSLYRRADPNGVRDYREEEVYFKSLISWTPTSKDSLALGAEFSYERFGHRGTSYPYNHPATTTKLFPVKKPWHTKTYSLLGEYHRTLLPGLEGFASFRLDDHSYTDALFSPRLALIWNATENTKIKAIAARATRRPGDDELHYQYVNAGSKGKEEILQYFEFRVEQSVNRNLWVNASAFYEIQDAVAHHKSALGIGRSQHFGTFDIWGIDMQVIWEVDPVSITLSHGYAALLDSKLIDNQIIQIITAEPYGYGDSLAGWSDHISKIFLTWDVREDLIFTSSLIVYWGFPGSEDLARWNTSQPKPQGWISMIDEEYDESFGSSWFLNFGLNYAVNNNIKLQADFHNVLGWIDDEYNKRSFIGIGGEYRAQAASISLSATFHY